MSLNSSQRQAVEHVQGPLLVLAGAGSGKTRVITHRIARLIDRGVRPEAILAVSFTNKASAEMAERMAKLIGPKMAKKVLLSTFHSFGVRFLHQEKGALGYDGKFVVFDQGDSLGLVRELLRRLRPNQRKLDPSALQARISLWKNAFIPPERVVVTDFEYDDVASEIYPEYEQSLRSMRAVDFDDLVVVPARLLKEHTDIRDRWRGKLQHVLIDEFQDTNGAQMELAKQLTNALNNICVVGDDDQSIYGWRGADVRNILEFEKTFPGTKVVKLEDNYRSVAPILKVANHAIAQSKGKRHIKQLRAARGSGARVRLCPVTSPDAEARLVAREINELHKEGRRFSDMAVLYRSNRSARLLEEELRAHKVPYRMVGGTQFYDRKEVKDSIAYLRAVANPWDELALRRILNYPPRGVGHVTVQQIDELARREGKGFSRAVQRAPEALNLGRAASNGIKALNHHLQEARERLQSGDPLRSVAKDLLEGVRLRDDIDSPEDGEKNTTANNKRWENVEHFLSSMERYEGRTDEGKPSLEEFLQRMTLRVETEEEEANNTVVLSTLHAAKGLEFPAVFFIGCVEGQLPHRRTTDPNVKDASPTDVEEERRLFYVGVTRARDLLYLSYTQQRMMRGKTIPLARSRFLEGLPENFTEEYVRPDEEASQLGEVADFAASLIAQLES